MIDRTTYPIGINVFVLQSNKLLLGKRKNCAGEGEWGLPGGHLEFGESMISAAARELTEETSLEVDKLTFLNLANDNSGREQHYVQVGFLAEGITGEVKLMEPELCSEWKWFQLDELPDTIFFGHSTQIKLFLQGLSFGDTNAWLGSSSNTDLDSQTWNPLSS
jgi:8-oxo-dGTP diphosphatase